jgi:hypothetical protein
MAWNEIERYTRSYGNEARPAFPAPVKVGDRIRISRLQAQSHWFRKNGYKAKVTGVKWGTLPGSTVWQWIVTEEHVPDTKKRDGTRLKNPRRRIQAEHATGYTKIEILQSEKAKGVLQMYGPEQPPFLAGDQIRRSYRRDSFSMSPHQFWTYGEIAGVNDTRTRPDVPAQYSFNIREFLERSSMTGFGFKPSSWHIQPAKSKRHFA